jgi:MOSC domain-containing protein YiiM
MAVCRKSEPGLPKLEVEAIQLIENIGVSGDYHAGKLVRHRFLAKKDPTQPNLRQVLLADTSIQADVSAQGIALKPGMLGENVLVDGIKVMALAVGTRLELGEALLELTGVRNPCHQLNEMHPDLLKAVATKVDGQVCRNAGMLARVLRGGWVRPGDPARVHSKADP